MTKLAQANDDDFDKAFPNAVLTHVLTVTAPDQLGVALEILTRLAAQGAELQGLSLGRSGTGFEHRLRITGIKSSEARRLAAQLAEVPGVTRAAIEHQLLVRPPEPAAP